MEKTEKVEELDRDLFPRVKLLFVRARFNDLTSTLIAAPISRPIDCATNDVRMHMFKYMRKRSVSSGCDVMKYTIIT
jgi:hypothetical protein